MCTSSHREHSYGCLSGDVAHPQGHRRYPFHCMTLRRPAVIAELLQTCSLSQRLRSVITWTPILRTSVLSGVIKRMSADSGVADITATTTTTTTELWWGNVREVDRLEDLGVDGSVILKFIFKKCDENLDWINLAQDRKRWRARVNAVMNFYVP